MSEKNKLEFTRIFETDKRILSEIESIIIQIQKQFPIEKDKFHNILVATTEAIINAIQHGNKNNPDKKVKLTITANKKAILVIVEDEGEGFDPSKLEDPRTPENILKERGRGIFIIKQLADSTTITTSKSGTTVKMTFKI